MGPQPQAGRNVRVLLWAVIAAAALALGVILRALWIQFGQTALVPPEVAGGIPAGRAIDVLSAWASGWHSDAGMVSCTTSHHKDAGADEAWTCQVYSSEAQSIALVRVTGGDATLLRETAPLYPQTVLPRAAWQTDSAEALKTWWRHGGRDAWGERGVAALHLRLGTGSGDAPTWQISVESQGDAEMSFWEISATSGVVLETREVRDS